MKFTAWITGHDGLDPYAEQLTVEGTRDHADKAFRESLLPGEEVRSVREGGGGKDITLRGGPS